MLAMGATKAKKMKASKGATKSRATRRRWARALRSSSSSLLLKEPLIEFFAQVFAVVGPENTVSFQTGLDMRSRKMVDHVFRNQFHRRAAWRPVSNILESGQGLG